MRKKNLNHTVVGRSLLELLAVLVIVGVLTFGVVAWLSQSLDRHHAKQVYKDIAMRAATLASYRRLTDHNKHPSVHDNLAASENIGWPSGYETVSEGITYHYYKADHTVFAIQAIGLSKEACQYLRDMSFENSILLGTTERRMMSYNESNLIHPINGAPNLACTGPTSSPLFYFRMDDEYKPAGYHYDACPDGTYGNPPGVDCRPCPCSPEQTTSVSPYNRVLGDCTVVSGQEEKVAGIDPVEKKLICQPGFVLDGAAAIRVLPTHIWTLANASPVRAVLQQKVPVIPA